MSAAEAAQDSGTPAREPSQQIDVAANLKLVHHTIRQRGLDRRAGTLGYEDLVQAGSMGLMRAAQSFKPELGYRFSTFATWWIRHHVARTIQDHAATVRVPVHLQERRSRQGVHPRASVYSLDAPLGDDDGATHLDMMHAPEADPLEAREAEDRARMLADLLDAAKLSERERGILRERTVNGRTYVGTSDALGLGLSRERVRQLERDALRKLRLAALRLAREGVEL